jgi:hypothetical protein
MGSKAQRQNQHLHRVMAKIRKFEKKGKNTDGLQKELSYCMGDTPRPESKTGRDADPRLKKHR